MTTTTTPPAADTPAAPAAAPTTQTPAPSHRSHPAPMPYSAGAPRRSRWNWRLIALGAVVVVPFLIILYIPLHQMLTGGITQHDGYADVDLKSLGYFPFDQMDGKLEDVPARYRALDGKRVMLKGYAFSTSSAVNRGSDMQIVYNIAKCCFSGPPQVQERVFLKVPDRVPFQSGDFVSLTGILHVHVIKNDAGIIQSVYEMDVEKAEPLS